MQKKVIEEMAQTLQKEGLSRRDALKIAGVASAAALVNPKIAEAATEARAASGAKGKIVIIGAGAGGISLAAKLNSMLSNPDITIVDATEKHMYQPAYTLIGGGVVSPDYPVASNSDYMPSGVKWVKEMVEAIDPDAKTITTNKGNVINYDILVVAAGIDLHFGGQYGIKGLSDSDIGQNGIMSIYSHSGATAAWKQLQEMGEESKKRPITALFHESPTPIKCGGAPKKIMYLAQDYLRNKNGNRANATLTLMTPGGAMFGVKVYNDAIFKQFDKRDMKYKFKHKLVEINPAAKEATFEREVEVMDADLGIKVAKKETVTEKYDYIHITPHMRGAKCVADSKLALPNGYMKVNVKTLQSTDYPNVFGIGDIVATPFGKTGGSVRKHYPVVAQNIVDVLEGKAPSAEYNGYTVCPVITGYGSIMMAEFGYKGADGSDTLLPSAPLDPTQERWMWWLLKVYGLKPMYFSGMLRGKA